MQSRKDTTVAPESARIVCDGISTPPDQKRIVWFEVTEHEMFRQLCSFVICSFVIRKVYVIL